MGGGGGGLSDFFFFKRKIKLIIHTSARPANCIQWQASHYFFSFFFTFNKKIHLKKITIKIIPPSVPSQKKNSKKNFRISAGTTSQQTHLTAPSTSSYFAEGEKHFGFFSCKRPFFFYRKKGKGANCHPLIFAKNARKGGGQLGGFVVIPFYFLPFMCPQKVSSILLHGIFLGLKGKRMSYLGKIYRLAQQS